MKYLLTLLAMMALASQPGSAQVVRGRVVDAASGSPLSGARVTLRRSSDSAGLTVSTYDDGTFAIRVSGAGEYLVDVVRLGYAPAHHGPVPVSRAQPVTVDVSLQQIPYTLGAVTVVGDANAAMLDRVGWYTRQKSDFGRFITRKDIESHHVSRLTDLLTTVPGVTLVADPQRPGHVRVQMRGSHLAAGGLCEPRVFLDGLIVIRGGSGPIVSRSSTDQNTEAEDPFRDSRSPEASLDDVVAPGAVEAIEVYRTAAQVPAEFGGSGIFTRCGVVVIWTRKGR